MASITTDSTTIVDGYLAAYGEPDASRRDALLREVWAQDGELVDPPLAARGHDAIGAMAEAVQQQFPGHRFRRSTGIDGHHDRVRFGWELVGPGGEVALTGMDVGELAPDGRLRRIVGFFGELPPLAG